MKLGVYSACLPSLTPDEAIAAAATSGYSGIEWRVATDVGNGETPHFLTNNRCTVRPESDDVAALCARTADAGLENIGLGVYVDFGDLAAVEHSMELARASGVERIRLRAPWMGDDGFHTLFGRGIEYFDAVAELAGTYGVQALLEMHQRSVCPSASLAHSMVGHLPADRVAVIYDVGNLVVEGYEDHAMALQILGDHLAHVHIKNAAFDAPASGGVWTHRWTSMDDGVADIPRVLRLLTENDYAGWVSVEDFSDVRPDTEALAFNARFLRDHADFDEAVTAHSKNGIS